MAVAVAVLCVVAERLLFGEVLVGGHMDFKVSVVRLTRVHNRRSGLRARAELFFPLPEKGFQAWGERKKIRL